jgi:hypothetical protein
MTVPNPSNERSCLRDPTRDDLHTNFQYLPRLPRQRSRPFKPVVAKITKIVGEDFQYLFPRLDAVMAHLERSTDLQLWPDANGNVPDWSPEQFALVRDAAAVWADLVRRRQDYDSAARTAGQRSTWPHA